MSHYSGDYGGHAHWDPMSFILHTQGQTLIGEAASALYARSPVLRPRDRAHARRGPTT